MVYQLTTFEALCFMGNVANIACQIWKARNNFVFNRVKVNPLNTMNLILHSKKEHSQSLEIPSVLMDNLQSQEEQSTWRAPDMGKIKVNCDVALHKSGNNSTISVVLRDRKGRIMDGLAKTVHVESSLNGELQAIRMACVMLFLVDGGGRKSWTKFGRRSAAVVVVWCGVSLNKLSS
ncbi:hypothetical protein Vadar_023997 [Vaccinium darrowii]|uniref:Uncharacterized protein n=1 Tax=Vaccinium darrowii TaxID=229202 RepID=A0ACB7Y2X6_9ERIC|nr:hypothetical protein Vadar_023997 [Vaccinium darrowii]